ncbi:MAG: hypothetical protein RB191_03535 [Terriglobia bacterium]|nr:hypothetical protein [Terriglobia bacterium]
MKPLRLTPQQLIEHLAKSGRFIERRTLTSWRTMGLLPQLKSKGRGKGPGKIQYWDDPQVIDQAIILCDTMETKRRSDFARWVLWFCGYDVDPELVRKYWLKVLKRKRLSSDAEPGELVADKYAIEIDRLTIDLSEIEYLDAQTAPPIAREIIIAANEPANIPMVRDEFDELFEVVRVLVQRFNSKNQLDISTSRKSLREFVGLFRKFTSNVALQKTLEEISADELRRAQSYLRAVGSLLRVGASQGPEIDEFQILELRRQVAPVFGRIIFEAILVIMNSGQEKILVSARSVIFRIAEGCRLQVVHPKIKYEAMADFDKLLNVFSDLDWRRLYKNTSD